MRSYALMWRDVLMWCGEMRWDVVMMWCGGGGETPWLGSFSTKLPLTKSTCTYLDIHGHTHVPQRLSLWLLRLLSISTCLSIVWPPETGKKGVSVEFPPNDREMADIGNQVSVWYMTLGEWNEMTLASLSLLQESLSQWHSITFNDMKQI